MGAGGLGQKTRGSHLMQSSLGWSCTDCKATERYIAQVRKDLETYVWIYIWYYLLILQQLRFCIIYSVYIMSKNCGDRKKCMCSPSTHKLPVTLFIILLIKCRKTLFPTRPFVWWTIQPRASDTFDEASQYLRMAIELQNTPNTVFVRSIRIAKWFRFVLHAAQHHESSLRP